MNKLFFILKLFKPLLKCGFFDNLEWQTSGKLGAVAHLGERVVRNDEVASSILVSSTNLHHLSC